MEFERASRNDPCPCGSGRKYKKCCYQNRGRITQLDRAMAIELMEQYGEYCSDRNDAMDVFFDGLDIDVPAMSEDFRAISDAAFLYWLVFDYELADGSLLVDRILKENTVLAAGEQRYLEQLRDTAMLPYEVLDVRPGESVLVRSLVTQEETEVREKTASKVLARWDLVVARINPLGPSGGAEFEAGAFFPAPLSYDEIKAIVANELPHVTDPDERLRSFKELGADFHVIWLESIVEPKFPRPVTPEGDPVRSVSMLFEVLDEPRLRAALDSEPALVAQGDIWDWVVNESSLASFELVGGQLRLQAHSEPRSERGRQLLKRLASDAVAYQSCEVVDLYEKVLEAHRRGERPEPPREADLSPEVKDKLFQEYMAKHSQQWLDDQIPALDLQTPRAAAQSATLQPRLVELLKDIENQYLRSLAAGEPAFDPTWMWDELGLSEHQDAPRVRHAVQLAHESLEQLVPGVLQVIRAVVEAPPAEGDQLLRTAFTPADLRTRAEVQELIRRSAGRVAPDELLAQLEFYCNYELHRRKTFWVDESLAWMLANTQVDAEASLFRLPFPSFVLVYTDRHTLSAAERALAGSGVGPLRGQMLSILCAYISELAPDSSRVKIGLTFDALAGQPPQMLSWELQIDPSETLEKAVTDALARAQTPAAGLFQPLLEAVLNATLYTTSASVQLDQHRRPPPKRDESSECLPSGDVYYLPGKIKISHMRKLQQLARAPSGRTLMHRFMVRGHWRRPGANWADQSLRWIEPYWRGPSLASIVEREYRLTT